MPPVFGPSFLSKTALWSWAGSSIAMAVAGDDCEDAGFRAGQVLDDHAPAGLAEDLLGHHGVARGNGLFGVFAHRIDAFARGQAVGLEDERIVSADCRKRSIWLKSSKVQ